MKLKKKMLHSSVALAMGATFVLPIFSVNAAEKENTNNAIVSSTRLAGGISNISYAQGTQTMSANSNFVIGQLTQDDINLINSNAENAGYRVREKRNIITSLAKKLAVKALRTSAGFLEAGLAKVIGKSNAAKATKGFHKIASYIEKVEKVQEHGIASILMQGGLPPDVAWETAKWIVLFFGL